MNFMISNKDTFISKLHDLNSTCPAQTPEIPSASPQPLPQEGGAI